MVSRKARFGVFLAAQCARHANLRSGMQEAQTKLTEDGQYFDMRQNPESPPTPDAAQPPTTAASSCRDAFWDKRLHSAVQVPKPIMSVAPLWADAASSERHSVL